MNSHFFDYDPRLNDVAQAIVADDRELIRACLDNVFDQSVDSAEAWLIHAWASESLQGTETALQNALEIDRDNPIACAGMNWIRGIQNFARVQINAQLQAEEAERARAVAARLAAEEEARRQAEAERRRAEQETRRQAEQEARIRAEEEARLLADEARLKAEENARLKAEKEEQIQEEKRQIEQAELAREELEAQILAAEQAKWAAENAQIEEINRLSALEQLQRCGEPTALQSRVTVDKVIGDSDVFAPETAAGVDVRGIFEDEPCDAIECELIEAVDSLASEVEQQVRPIQIESGDHEMAPKPAMPTGTSGRCILAVDDSPTIRKLVSLALSKEGFEVISAEDGVEALSIIAQRLPDLILSDINMPKLGGYKLCKFVKKHDRTSHIPFIMLSGKDGVFDRMRGKMSGCNAFLTKPFESNDLVKLVRAQLAASVSN